MRGIFVAEVDVAHCIIDLVEVVLVLVTLGHSLQSGNHLTELTLVHHLCLHDASVEGYFVRRIGTYHLGECFVSQRITSRFMIELCKQEVKACLRQLAFCRTDCVLQMRYGLVVLMRKDIISRLCIIDLLLSLASDTIALHFVQKVFSIIRPVQCNIASSQLCFCDRHDVWLRAIQSNDVVVCSSRFEELAFLELSISHPEPSMIHVWVELLAGKELLLLFRTLLVTLDDGTLLDAVHLDGLLALRDGSLEVALSYISRRLVGADVHRKYLVEVVLMAFILCLSTFEISHIAVEERVIMSSQSMIGTCG